MDIKIYLTKNIIYTTIYYNKKQGNMLQTLILKHMKDPRKEPAPLRVLKNLHRSEISNPTTDYS